MTDIYDLDTSGRESGAGTFMEGTVTKIVGGYHLTGASKRGYNFGTYLDVVYVDYFTEPKMEVHDEMGVAGMEFRLGKGELHLREPV